VLLVARLVAPERQALRFGDQRWAERVERLREMAAETIARHGGQPLAVGLEEFGARFDGPARAVRGATDLREAAAALGADLAAAVHAGEIELRGESVTGLALHVTSRIAARAAAGEILVSGVVNDLATGSGLHFAERGSETIDGCEGPVRTFVLVTEEHLQPVARTSKAAGLDVLSAREREVLELVAKGLSNAAIAERLGLSEHTAKRHVANILLKLDLRTRAAAAALIGDTTGG
jgi:DNA-binding CsgD family transcriptional regulator